MSTSQLAIDNVQKRSLPYWKLYKGSQKISQCSEEENPDANPQVAFELFQEEVTQRIAAPGNYYVNCYRKIKGESGGFRYDFLITGTETISQSRPGSIDMNELYERAKRDVEMALRLERIEDKLDTIIKYIASKETSDKGDDNEVMKMVFGLAGQAWKTSAAANATAAAPVIKANGFNAISSL